MDVQKAIIVGWTKNKNQNNWSHANCFSLGFQLQDGLQSDIFMAVFHRLQSFHYKSWTLHLVVPIAIMARQSFESVLVTSHQMPFRHPLMVTFSRANINSGSPKMEIGKTTMMKSIRQPSWGASGVDQTFSVHSQWCLINTISEWAGRLLQRCRCGPGHSSQVSPLAMACCVFV